MVKNTDIKEELIEVKKQLNIAHNGFDNATNPQLINAYIYEIKALNERFSYLLGIIKE